MAKVPPPVHATVAAIYAAWQSREDRAPRPYLGASELGHSCARRLWYGLRWARPKAKEGRMLRLLDHGQREEARVFEDLRAIGVQVVERQPDGRQWRVEFCGGHGAGHLDAAAAGFPEAPASWHVVEVKTSNTKAFRELQAKGVREAKPMHYAQMVLYMHLTGMERAAYVCVAKETDDIYFERVHADPVEAERLLARARSIVFAAEPPLRLSNDSDYFECRWCDYASTCHGTDVPDASCRSCAHVTPAEDGTWRCEAQGSRALPVAEQRRGCGSHRFIPILLERFAEHVGGDAAAVEYRHRETGRSIWNGAAPAYSSAEIAACADKTMLGDPGVDALRAEFDGEVVG